MTSTSAEQSPVTTDATAVEAPAAGPGADERPRRLSPAAGARWLAGLARTHWLLLVLLLVGGLVRLAAIVAYYPGFGYFVDTYAYMASAKTWIPDRIWPFGYPLMIAILSPAHRTVVIPLAQHLMGLGMGVVVYALLRRRGVRRGWAVLAAAPVVLDAHEIVVEHYVLSDTLFTVLLFAAVALLLWFDRLPVWAAGLAGFALAASALTRTIGQPIAILAVLYLLARRVGWRPLVTFALALVIPLGGYAAWFHHYTGKYEINDYTGRYLWSRTTTFVDCSRVRLSPQQRVICPAEPVDQRLGPDSYLWTDDKADLIHKYPDDTIYRNFAIKAILAQPGDYARTVLTDAVYMVEPGWSGPTRTQCVRDLWEMPSKGVHDQRKRRGDANCSPPMMVRDYTPGIAPATYGNPSPLTASLGLYGQYVYLSPLALAILTLIALCAACWRPRRGFRDVLDTLFLSITGVALVMISLAISAIDPRYSYPLLVLAPAAAVIAIRRLAAARERPSGADAGRPETEPAGG